MIRIRQWLLIALLALAGNAFAVDSMRWDIGTGKVDANIETWPVQKVLARIAGITGWQVFMDPSITNVVSTKFRERTSGEALQRLLGTLNYALLPETNGPSRLFVFRNAQAEATQAVTPSLAEKKTRIENELVATLKPGEKIDDLAKKLGAKVVGRADDLNTYRLRFDDSKAADKGRTALQSESSVASVEDNYYINRPEMAQSYTGPNRPLGLNAGTSPDQNNVIVALLDTKVQGKEGGISDFLLPEINVADPCDTPPTGLTHGTAMASTILRSLQGARGAGSTSVRILPINIYGCGESTSTFDVARGIYEASKAGASIINASLGSEGNSPFLENTVDAAVKNGAKIYAAAGNEPVTTPVYPAAYPPVTAVTAGYRPGEIAPWANHGSFIDMIAPANSVVNYNNQQFIVTGTSASTAYASGAAAGQIEANRKK